MQINQSKQRQLIRLDPIQMQPAKVVVPDNLDARQWSLDRIQINEAWNHGTGRGGPIVAVLDTGVDVEHPDLKGNIWTNSREIPANGIDDDYNGVVDDVHGYNAIENSGNVKDGGEHGTHVAGIIGAVGNNGQGISGISWQAQIMPIRIFDANGNSSVEAIINGIHYAQEHGATILNCSFGGAADYIPELHQAMAEFPGLIVCSAGNSGSDNDVSPHYPSSFDNDNLISVAASSRADKLCFTSCYGATSVDVGAPGEQILSTIPNGRYGIKSGTSQAAPHVSGLAALLASQYPQASPAQLKTAIIHSVDHTPELEHTVLSQGRMNAAKAVRYLENSLTSNQT